MNCLELENEIVEYYLGELPPERMAEFDKHLQLCPDCAKFAYRISCGIDRVRGSLPARPATDVWPVVRERIARRSIPVPRWVLVPVLGALLAALVSVPLFKRVLTVDPSEVRIVHEVEMLADYEILKDLDVLEQVQL